MDVRPYRPLNIVKIDIEHATLLREGRRMDYILCMDTSHQLFVKQLRMEYFLIYWPVAPTNRHQ